MTRTDLPNLQQSIMYQAAEVKSISTHAQSYCSCKQCDSTYICALKDIWNNTKGHGHMFDTESLHTLKYNTIEMEYPYRRADKYTAYPEVAGNLVDQQQRHRLRFSSPDIYNLKVTSQNLTAEMTGEGLLKRRTRSRSAPRVQTNFIPLTPKASPPVARKKHDVQRSPKHMQWGPEVSTQREPFYALSQTLNNKVHPIKLQPQKTDSSMNCPVYFSESLEMERPERRSTSPHVRCRLDIKPDKETLQQHGQQSFPRVDNPWPKFPSTDSQNLKVPFHFSVSRTPTPTESFIGDYRPTYQYSQRVPNTYMLPPKTSLQQLSAQQELRNYYGREHSTHLSQTTNFFNEEDLANYGSPALANQDEYFNVPSQTNTPKHDYVHDQSAYVVHTIPARAYFTEIDLHHDPLPKYPNSHAYEPGQYIIQTPPARTFYRDDPRTYQIQKVPPEIFYVGDSYMPPLEPHIPANFKEGRNHAHMVQPQSHDWYGSDVSGYSTHYSSSYTSQGTPTRVRQEPMLTSWYTNPCVKSARVVTDQKPYSRSWDNILSTNVEREQPMPCGKSDENLICQGKQALSKNDKRPVPVVVNLSSSPRRYAALSLSDTSLMEKTPNDFRHTPSKQWFLTPEITITDNDNKPSKGNKAGARSASFDVLDYKSSLNDDASYTETIPFIGKEKTHYSASLQQSLEQLDKLLADLVTDYKPRSSGGPSEDLLDNLKTPTDKDEAVSSRKIHLQEASGNTMPLNKQPAPIESYIERETERSCDDLQSREGCSPDQSPDADDTMMCSNNKCRRIETLFNACLYFKSCHSCYTYYCSRNCRREDWDIHKESCLYGRIGSVCRHIIKFCRETAEVHKAFSRIAKVGYLSRGRGVLFLGFPNPASSTNFLQFGLESLLMSPTYLSVRELDGFKDNLGEYCKELQDAGKEYDPNECFLLNVSIAVGEQLPDGPSPRVQTPTVRKYAKVALASYSTERKVHIKESDMETLILTPPPGTTDIDKEGEQGRKAREICFINIQRELRIRGVFLRQEYPQVYQKLCEFVESNRRFTPTTIYPFDKRTGKQFMCMIMAASEPRTLDWVATPHLLDDII
ncbi:apical junction component 1 homolog [Trichomycterus rosablanca]|uniref:apical junction component 1 homolog n=1 Tax=Trichomycterus rosablanca TaxID=2290929 RepID=UPI002F34FEF4